MSGDASKLAIAQGSTWLTAIALGTDHRLPFRSCTLDNLPQLVQNDDLNGSGVRESGHVAAYKVAGGVGITGDYHQFPHMLLAALMMGQSGAPTESPTDVHTHAMAFQPNTDGKFATIGVDYGGVDVHGFASLKPTRRVLVVEPSGRLEEDYEFIGAGVDKTISSGAWTYKDDPRNGGTLRVLQRHLTIRANANSGGALGSSDAITPLRMEIEFSRPLTEDPGAGGLLEEPVASDFAAINITLGFKSMTAALRTLFGDARDADSALKMDVTFDYGVVIPTTAVNYQRLFYFPKLKVIEAPNTVPGAGPIPYQVRLSAHPAASVPTGFPSGYTQPAIEEWVNDETDTVLS